MNTNQLYGRVTWKKLDLSLGNCDIGILIPIGKEIEKK